MASEIRLADDGNGWKDLLARVRNTTAVLWENVRPADGAMELHVLGGVIAIVVILGVLGVVIIILR